MEMSTKRRVSNHDNDDDNGDTSSSTDAVSSMEETSFKEEPAR
jgi:hypothetical protein